MKPKAIILLSGGMDSCVTLAQAIYDGTEPCALHVNYGQKTQDRELQSYANICDHYKIINRLVTDISHLKSIGGSSLTDVNISVKSADLTKQTIPDSYVPFRNANILAIAVSWLEVIGASSIYIGAVDEDSSGYPDCRRPFFDAFEKMANLGSKPESSIQIRTPIIHLKKSEIVLKGNQLKAPLHLTWSCYQQNDQACGTCDSCALRLRGFQIAGLHDPIDYKSRPMYS